MFNPLKVFPQSHFPQMLVIRVPSWTEIRLKILFQNEIEINQNCGWRSVTRSGNLLDFGQLFKAFGNN